MIVHITSPRKYVYSRTSDPLLAYLDFQKWLSVERLIMTIKLFGDLGD